MKLSLKLSLNEKKLKRVITYPSSILVMNLFNPLISPYVFELVGDYDELTLLRTVSKEFKRSIKKYHVTQLIMNKGNQYVLWACSKTLVDVECNYILTSLGGKASLPPLPNNKRLLCNGNQLTSLPPLPNNIELECNRNTLTSLPPLPNNSVLHCSGNQLTSLPQLPNNKYLYCNRNQLTSLPPLPSNKLLWCIGNQLTSIPSLPNNRELNCIGNHLTFLPPLPNNEELYCGNNQLTSLPPLPKNRLLDYRGNNNLGR